jgi:hypothetical protein
VLFYSRRLGYAICGGRSAGELFENAIELRERLEPNCECDLANSKIDIVQKPARLFEASARNVLDKICAGDLLELLAEMIPANVRRFRYSREGKFFGEIFIDEVARLPNLHRFGSMLVA